MKIRVSVRPIDVKLDPEWAEPAAVCIFLPAEDGTYIWDGYEPEYGQGSIGELELRPSLARELHTALGKALEKL